MKEINVPGSKTLLMGDVGGGKTHALQTFIEAGITPFILCTEPGINATLGHISTDKIKWAYIEPANASWTDMIDSARKINTLTFKSLSQLEGINKSKFNQFIKVLTTLSNFVDDRTGEVFGAVDTWGTDRVLCLDSMSGLSIMAMDLVVGSKPVKSQSDWGVAMDNLNKIVDKLCCSINCHFVMTCHPERERDEISGAVKLMPSTLGQKLSPKIPRYFDNVIEAYQDGKDWRWRTLSSQASLKARHLPVADKLIPSFVPVIDDWKLKGGKIVKTVA